MTLIGLMLIAGLLLVIIGLTGILLTMAEEREDGEPAGDPSAPAIEGDPFAEIETTNDQGQTEGDADT